MSAEISVLLHRILVDAGVCERCAHLTTAVVNVVQRKGDLLLSAEQISEMAREAVDGAIPRDGGA